MKVFKDEFCKYKFDTLKELEVKDKVFERQKHFTDILMKELAFAKNIIKNPNLFQKAFEKLNFDRMELYQFEKIPKPNKPLRSDQRKLTNYSAMTNAPISPTIRVKQRE